MLLIAKIVESKAEFDCTSVQGSVLNIRPIAHTCLVPLVYVYCDVNQRLFTSSEVQCVGSCAAVADVSTCIHVFRNNEPTVLYILITHYVMNMVRLFRPSHLFM
jgi:hypothetical protein